MRGMRGLEKLVLSPDQENRAHSKLSLMCWEWQKQITTFCLAIRMASTLWQVIGTFRQLQKEYAFVTRIKW